MQEHILKCTGLDPTLEYGHRSGPKRDDGKARFIIVRFLSRLEKREVMSKKDKLFKAGILIFDDIPKADLVEKKKHSAEIKNLYTKNKDLKIAFFRGKWHVNGKPFVSKKSEEEAELVSLGLDEDDGEVSSTD